MENTPQAVRNCYTCKQDLPNSNFEASRTLRSIQDDPAEYRFGAITAQGREEDRLAGRPDASKADRASVFVFRDPAPALPELPRPLLGPFTPGVVDDPPSFTPRPGLPTVVLGTPILRSTHSTAPVVVLGTPIPQESLPPTPSLPPQSRRRGCYARQSSQPQERQFDQIVDPPFTRRA
ncbi:ATP-dependent DNA helicase PIF1, partial [Metarhizium majus ARSEF 297]